MKRLLLVFHSQSGRTAQLADAAAQGVAALADSVELRVRRAPEATLEDLLWAEGLLLGTPENFGYLSGLMKDFLDRTYYPAEGKTIGLPWALFVSAGNDGSGAVRALQRIALGYQWREVAAPVIVRGEPDAAGLSRCSDLAQTLAAGLALGLF